MKLIIDIDDEQVLFDIKNRGLESETETDKVIINALYDGIPLDVVVENMRMKKEDILHHFQDINFYYNDCMMYADLSGMLDELISESEEPDGKKA